LVVKITNKWTKIKRFTLNFGPQHPAAHGVLRLVLHLKGESIFYIDPHIGLLHRGTEKLIEQKTYLQSLPYFDRLDYVSTMCQEHTFSLNVEHLFHHSIHSKQSYIRVLFLELTRILNHMMAITTHALDLGALTPFLWGFEEREKIMDFYERVCGARLHASYIYPGGFMCELPDTFLFDLLIFCYQFKHRIEELEHVLTNNSIWWLRLKHIGILSKQFSLNYSHSGVLLRSTGYPFDLRDSYPYEVYETLNFSTYISSFGDCFDRYLLRIWEMRESIYLIEQIIVTLNKWHHHLDLVTHRSCTQEKKSMEVIINSFKKKEDLTMFQPMKPQFNSNYISTEAPKGEFGLFMISNQGFSPYRCYIRAPGFFHLQSIDSMTTYHFISDLVAIIGTQDIVFGEIDR